MSTNSYTTTAYEGIAIFGRAGRAVGVIVCALAMLSACNGSDIAAPLDSSINATVVSGAVASYEAGETISSPIQLAVTKADGSPVSGATVTWAASSNGSVSTSESRTDSRGVAAVLWTLGGKAGQQTLTATANGSAPVTVRVNAIPGQAANIKLAGDSLTLSVLGDTVPLSAQVTDRHGNPVAATTAWFLESGNEAVQLLPHLPAAVAKARGTATVVVKAEAATARFQLHVSPAAPRPLRVVGDSIFPGVPFVLDGESFSNDAAAIQMVVHGKPASILSATRTRIEAILPAGSVACQATGTTQLKVTIAGARGEIAVPLRTATRISLKKGESVSLLDANQAKCAELAGEGNESSARYVVAVLNTSRAVSSVTGFELRGNAGGNLAGVAARNLDVSLNAERAKSELPAALKEAVRSEHSHGSHLDRQREIVRKAGSPSAAWRIRNSGTRASLDAAVRSVGDIVTVKALYNSCSTGRDIQARVVYAGARAVVLEDLRAPRAGTMDSDYRAIGQEFDVVQYPLLTSSLGDPLAMNESMNGDGRITMLFTQYVNDSVPGIAGYVTACNFYPRSVFTASNEDEIFYARVPQANESPAEWRRGMRSTVVHEAKHLASFAERISRGHAFEESWLEEATARVAEELYSREFSGGGSWKGNTGFSGSVRCELYQCDSRPLMMWKHFSALHSWQQRVDELTPIGASSGSDYSFYASGWSLVRWAADHYATSESEWLKALVRGNGSASGLTNLAQQTGRSAEAMLSDWALATATDDIAGFVPQRAELSMPSWNTADVMKGLAQTYPGAYQANPLKMRNYSFGEFVLTVEQLRSYSASYFSFTGNQGGSQVISLSGQGGAVAPGGLRVAVVRVE